MNTEAAKTLSHSPLKVFMFIQQPANKPHYMNSHQYSSIRLILQTQHLKPHTYFSTPECSCCFFPILILEKEPVFSLLNVQC